MAHDLQGGYVTTVLSETKNKMKIIEYIKKEGLLHPGNPRIATKSEKAKHRKAMRMYWQMKDTTFDEK